jgi:hypothetical protein
VPVVKVDALAWIKSMENQYATALQAAIRGGKGNDLFKKYPKNRSQSLEIIRLLLNHGADVNAPGSDHGDALQIAIKSNDKEMVKFLLSVGADVNVKRSRGDTCTALITAAASWMWEDTTILELLLDRGADVNAIEGFWGTAVCAAAFGGWKGEKPIRLLLAHGAFANLRGGPNAKFVNPLHAAVSRPGTLQHRLGTDTPSV